MKVPAVLVRRTSPPSLPHMHARRRNSGVYRAAATCPSEAGRAAGCGTAKTAAAPLRRDLGSHGGRSSRARRREGRAKDGGQARQWRQHVFSPEAQLGPSQGRRGGCGARVASPGGWGYKTDREQAKGRGSNGVQAKYLRGGRLTGRGHGTGTVPHQRQRVYKQTAGGATMEAYMAGVQRGSADEQGVAGARGCWDQGSTLPK